MYTFTDGTEVTVADMCYYHDDTATHHMQVVDVYAPFPNALNINVRVRDLEEGA